MGYYFTFPGLNKEQVSDFNHDRQLLKGLVNNVSQSIETIYKENYGLVLTLVERNNGSEDEAKDIFQEALLVLYENGKTEGFELNCKIKTYLYSVARRLWLKKLQSKKQTGRLVDNFEELISVEDSLDIQEKKNKEVTMLNKALDELGEPCRSLIESFYIKDKSMLEIANDFGYTNADNAKTQKYKCLVRLKKIFLKQFNAADRD